MKFFFSFDTSLVFNLSKNNNSSHSLFNNLSNNLDMTNYFLTMSKNTNYLKKKKNIFLNQKSIKFYKFFFSFSKLFFSSFLETSASNYRNYSYHLEIFSSLKNNLYLNNFLFLNSWYLNFFNFLFFLKIDNLKGRKLNEKSNSQKSINILNSKKRDFYYFKIIKNYFYILKYSKFSKYYYHIMFDTYLNFKNSYVYKNKINLYKKLISN